MKTLVTTSCIVLVLAACSGSETCPAGFLDCGLGCTDLLNDTENCGACMNACPGGHICQVGVCTLSCQEGYTDCSGTCRDTMTDQYNCGACGMTCAAGYVCVDGSCSPDCPEGYTSCSGVCRNTSNDPANCGECGTACASGEVCLTGTCTFTCPSPYTDCSGMCADLQTDHLNCGACGSACLAGQICVAGACENSCIAGLTLCSGACRDLMRDPDNCGSCGSPCGSGDVCYDGSCVTSCPGGFTDCTGSCRDLNSDRLNCGACETPCGDGEVCTSGTCTATCASPLISCPHDADGDTVMDGTICSDTSSDPRNCGGCAGSGGVNCARGEACVSGSCETVVCPAPTWSQSFTGGAVPPSGTCTSWTTWRTGLDATGCTTINISGTFDTTGVACTDPTTTQAIATALRTGATGSWSCDGNTWHVGTCAGGIELVGSGAACTCSDPGHILRPCIDHRDWGGVNTDTCNAPTQTMTITFY
jgi:hypothetical protein